MSAHHRHTTTRMTANAQANNRNWPTPILLKHIENGPLRVWNPKVGLSAIG